jgi:hypothetical protein
MHIGAISSFLDSVSYLFLNMGLITTRGLLFVSLPHLATASAVGNDLNKDRVCHAPRLEASFGTETFIY